MLEFNKIYKTGGIIKACLIDPLSLLINKILGLEKNDINAIGYYYEEKYQDKTKCKVILYNIYDNEVISWMKIGYTIDLLLVSPFVNKIIFYPLKNNNISSFVPLLTRQSLNTDMLDKFKNVADKISKENDKIKYDKCTTYTKILLQKLKQDGQIINGYDIIYKLYVQLTNNNLLNNNLSNLDEELMNCRIFENPLTIIAQEDEIFYEEKEYIIDKVRKDIVKLISVFIDLYTIDDSFKAIINKSKIINDNIITTLLNQEKELLENIFKGCNTGILHLNDLNNIITQLNNTRNLLSKDNTLKLSFNNNMYNNPSGIINIVNERQIVNNNDDNNEKINKLGCYLNEITNSLDDEEPIYINWNDIIKLYNDLNNNKIKEIDNKSSKSSREVILTFNNDIDNILRQKYKILTTEKNNLEKYSIQELIDILIYLDSLRDSNGNGNNKYCKLQNDITYELAQRNTNLIID
jgi:hypothetical protein